MKCSANCIYPSDCGSNLAIRCKKEDPNPELNDLVYKDLDKRASDAEKSYEEELTNKRICETPLETAEPNTIEHQETHKETYTARKSPRLLSNKMPTTTTKCQTRILAF